MKKMLAVIMSVLMASASIAFASARIQIPEVHWDYGNVPQNSTLSHAYWIRNVGDDTLRIDVKPG
jgi:hypothetical protein